MPQRFSGRDREEAMSEKIQRYNFGALKWCKDADVKTLEARIAEQAERIVYLEELHAHNQFLQKLFSQNRLTETVEDKHEG